MFHSSASGIPYLLLNLSIDILFFDAFVNGALKKFIFLFIADMEVKLSISLYPVIYLNLLF